MNGDAVRVGFYGKLPSRGDFVRSGLSRDFAAAWDRWIGAVMPAAQLSLGARWADGWAGAPSWRFALPAGICGTGPVSGVWLPSADSIGRAFPLLVAAETPAPSSGFLDAIEPIVREAVRAPLSPDGLAARLDAVGRLAPSPGREIVGACWWTAGGTPCAFPATLMPDRDGFLRMLMT